MPSDCISYQNSGYFSKLMVDYLNREPELQSLYHRFPSLDNLDQQSVEKGLNYPATHRKVLTEALEKQYYGVAASEKTKNNIELLKLENTFTITTGHQLTLFTGPLYFLYKIVSTINLCRKLQLAYPKKNFVPVYWMATEDHDFEEISYFYFKNRKIHWNRESSGPVGRLSTQGLEEVFEVFSNELGGGKNAEELRLLFRSAYLEHSNLAQATRFLANALFGEQGLVILDGDDAELKQLFVPFIKKEIAEQVAFSQVNRTNEKLSSYNIQVNPREINLFYIEDQLRERIVATDSVYRVNNTTLEFSKEEILELAQNQPQKFSPNVILRPLYQEVILPNLCYIGGGGELAYWLQLKSNFEANGITFPLLLLRNSVLLATEKQAAKADKLKLTWSELFLRPNELLLQKTKELSSVEIDFESQRKTLEEQFAKLLDIAAQTDKSFLGAVKAQQVKQLKGLNNLEQRLLKAEKRQHSDQLARITQLQQELFPNQSLQERKANFSEFYLENGNRLVARLLENLDPLSEQFRIIRL